MSILQEYEAIRRTIGPDEYRDIKHFLTVNPGYMLHHVYYYPAVWDIFEAWRKGRDISGMIPPADVVRDNLNEYFNREGLNEFLTDIDDVDEVEIAYTEAYRGDEPVPICITIKPAEMTINTYIDGGLTETVPVSVNEIEWFSFDSLVSDRIYRVENPVPDYI